MSIYQMREPVAQCHAMCILTTWDAKRVSLLRSLVDTALDPVPTHTHRNFPLECVTLILSLPRSLLWKVERQKPPFLALFST